MHHISSQLRYTSPLCLTRLTQRGNWIRSDGGLGSNTYDTTHSQHTLFDIHELTDSFITALPRSSLSLSLSLSLSAMCRHCLLEVRPDRARFVAESGAYTLNYAGCYQCSGESTKSMVKKPITSNNRSDSETTSTRHNSESKNPHG